jgi:hypothetical protein
MGGTAGGMQTVGAFDRDNPLFQGELGLNRPVVVAVVDACSVTVDAKDDEEKREWQMSELTEGNGRLALRGKPQYVVFSTRSRPINLGVSFFGQPTAFLQNKCINHCVSSAHSLHP